MTNKPKTIEDLKPFNGKIQVCPVCGKVDVYKDDGHNCFLHLQKERNND